MKTGFRGTFVISWSQTELDGLDDAPIDSLRVGTAWSWTGDAVRVDVPGGVLRLEVAEEDAGLRRRAARKVQRMVGAAVQNRTDIDQIEVAEPLPDSSFVVTDGAQTFVVTVIDVGPAAPPLLMFFNTIPPRGTDLWVVHHSLTALSRPGSGNDGEAGGVICFTPGTMIDTPDGPRRVETLREGDRVRTADSGAQDILWIGSRRMTGARLYVMPQLRPVRFRAGALGIGRPDGDLLVSPQHRMVVRGPAARALFNTTEVLVPARDLVNGDTVTIDSSVREATYIHLLLPHHGIIRANGLETESFHPASADLSSLAAADRDRLRALLPGIDRDPHSYGDYARRNLSTSETAILMHDAA
jgi:hypothetical protein